jgi:hypothetical protein
MGHHPLADRDSFHLAQLERQRHGDMTLLCARLADVELTCLAVMVGEALRAELNLLPLLL